jgi:dTDP-4-amino-4,6-dideoxygalactose transaminase
MLSTRRGKVQGSRLISRVPFFDLKRQYSLLSVEIETTVALCLASTQYINGEYVARFEHEIAEYLSVKHAIGVSNGTDALILALRAIGIQNGDEAITTPFSFFATAEAIAAIGAVPVFVDIREYDFNIDPGKIEAAITNKTKAILPVHIFGYPADIDSLLCIAKKHNLKLIDDAAQAIGSIYNRKKIGGLADATTWSFYPTKNLGGVGNGGMVTTNDDTIAANVRTLREHGSRNKKYNSDTIGYNARLDDVQASVLSVKLKYLDSFNQNRRQIADYYTQHLNDIVITPQFLVTGLQFPSVAHTPSWHQYAIRVKDKKGLTSYLAEKKSAMRNSMLYLYICKEPFTISLTQSAVFPLPKQFVLKLSVSQCSPN